MYRAKYQKRRRLSKRTVILLASLTLLMGLTIGSTAAYLVTHTSQVTNTFTPAKVSCVINETFKDNVKSDVTIKNMGNVDAYIRAMVIISWTDADGNIVPAPFGDPVFTTDANWSLNEVDGIYYYSERVAPNDSTTNLINSIAPPSDTKGYRLKVDIIADAIQADGIASSAQDAWAKAKD